MDSKRFDALTRTLSSRRTAVGGLLGGGFAVLLGVLIPEEAEAHNFLARCRRIQSVPRRRACLRRARAHTRTCHPQSAVTTCAGTCGTVSNNCGTPVDCGSCTCDASSCASGCCAGTTCHPDGESNSAFCGIGGRTCQTCGSHTVCSTGVCIDTCAYARSYSPQTRRPSLAGYDFSACDLTGALLMDANLSGANLISADLSGGANLSGANLSGANLISALLMGANLSGANLSGANLSAADLSGANLSGADLSGANLENADLGFTTLSGVTWGNTTCPDGTNSDTNDDGTCVGHRSF